MQIIYNVIKLAAFFKTQSTSDGISKLESLCLQTVKENIHSLSASTAELMTCDKNSDGSMESSLKNSINSDADIPSRSESAMSDQETDLYLKSESGSCKNYEPAYAMPAGQGTLLMNAKSQESKNEFNCCPNCFQFIGQCCNSIANFLKKN
ncbi:hypothetical protein T4D_14907 [Trichinella pseudospiralis]|uniref:Uncharacterized protein n=2 Tax=Trichinella pseudospiralis TaxID=6337 RepID=A0A0V1F5S2_TRIPS|nr:hypothetical protein T4D_14907 [Trichinella pseudospiralis]